MIRAPILAVKSLTCSILTMGRQRKSHHESSEGEDFDFDDANEFLDSEVEVIEEDNWQPIVLGQNAKHTDYEKASKSDFWILNELGINLS